MPRSRPSLLAWLMMLTACLLPAGARAQEQRSDVSTKENAAQRYDLYLPAGYPGERRWPVLIVLDPRGRADAALAMARPGAEANGWIVLAAHGSRSDDREQLTLDALQALLRELGARYAYDPKRVYLAGMSGTAKSLWVAENSLHGLVAGYIGAGGARPPELGPLRARAPAFFGFTGTRDFNHREMRELDDALERAGGAHRLEVFAGAHGWPDAEGFRAAIDWLELSAMREGRIPVREEFVSAQERIAYRRHAAATTPLERWRRLDEVLRDFGGLRELVPQVEEAKRLAATQEVRAARARERKLLAEEARFARALDDWATRLHGGASETGRLPPPDTSRTLSQLRIAALQARSREADAMVADSAARRLELAYAAAAHYLADEQERRGDFERARAALKFAAALFPDREYPACRLAGIAARRPLATAVRECGSSPVFNAR